MPAVLVDSNVLIDILAKNPVWEEWSAQMLRDAANRARLLINAVIYAEVSVNYDRIEVVDESLPNFIEREQIPYEAAFSAGKAFRQYRRRGGTRRSPLPDFFVGAHAMIGGYELLTRDPRRYRTYFPAVRLIAP